MFSCMLSHIPISTRMTIRFCVILIGLCNQVSSLVFGFRSKFVWSTFCYEWGPSWRSCFGPFGLFICPSNTLGCVQGFLRVFLFWPYSVLTLASPSLRLVPRLCSLLTFLPLRVSLLMRLNYSGTKSLQNRSRWIIPVKCFNDGGRISQVFSWFPSTLVIWISYPFYQVV